MYGKIRTPPQTRNGVVLHIWRKIFTCFAFALAGILAFAAFITYNLAQSSFHAETKFKVGESLQSGASIPGVDRKRFSYKALKKQKSLGEETKSELKSWFRASRQRSGATIEAFHSDGKVWVVGIKGRSQRIHLFDVSSGWQEVRFSWLWQISLLFACGIVAFAVFYRFVMMSMERGFHEMGARLVEMSEGKAAKNPGNSGVFSAIGTHRKLLVFFDNILKSNARELGSYQSKIAEMDRQVKDRESIDALSKTSQTASDLPPDGGAGEHPILRSLHEGLIVIDDNLKIGRLFSKQASVLLDEENLQGQDFFKILEAKSVSSSNEVAQLRDAFLMAFNLFITDQFAEVMKNSPRIFPMRLHDHNFLYEFNFAPYVQDESVKKIVVTFSDETDRQALEDIEGFAANKALDSIVRIHELVQGKWKAHTLLDFTVDNIQVLAQILTIIDEPYDADHVFRHLHNLKGAARTLDLQALARVAHSCENYVTAARSGSELNEDATMIFKSQLMALKDALAAMRDIVSPYIASQEKTEVTWTDVWESYAEEINNSMKSMAVQLGKEVQLIFNRPEALGDYDFRLLKQLLLHLMRNSLDHGIEKPDEREASGKQRIGNIIVAIHRDQDKIAVVLADDGRGLNFEVLWNKAQERDIETRHWKTWKEADALAVLCSPGFSSRDEVTDISGRGIGMDAVLHSMESVGGNLILQKADKTGMTFLIKWPAQYVAAADGEDFEENEDENKEDVELSA